jgi:hypothetical protein
MAYLFVAESPRKALSEQALAHFEEYLKYRNAFVAPGVGDVEEADDGEEDGVESNQHTIDDDVEIFDMDDP